MLYTVDVKFGVTVEATDEDEACRIVQATIDSQGIAAAVNADGTDYELSAWAE